MQTESIMEKAAGSRLVRSLTGAREFFLLREQLVKSRSLDSSVRAVGRRFELSGRARLHAADFLWNRGNAAPALELYREAAMLFARGVLAVQTRCEDQREPASVFDALREVLRRGAGPNLESKLERLRALMLGDPSEFENFDLPEDNNRIRELAEIARWLSEQVDFREPNAIKLRRAGRACVALVVCAALLFGVAKWAFAPTNLALHRPVRASSRGQDTVPEGAVDGIRYGQLGFHSENENAPWLTIELAQLTELREVRVFGRADCCFDQSIPLALEGSEDGINFVEIARRTKPFTQYEPWVVHPQGAKARFVRLRTRRHSYLVTSEVEVYGRPLMDAARTSP